METEILDSGLCAPVGYNVFTDEQLYELVNGCGPKGLHMLIPDIILGVDFTESCNIHDFCYYIGETIADKDFSDELFYWNMIVMVEQKGGNFLLRKLRERIAYKYYLAVKHSKLATLAFMNGE